MLKHQPVLLTEVLQYLNPIKDDSYLDLTAGYGGHAKAVLERTKSPQKAVLVDRDEQAIRTLKDSFAPSGAKIVHEDFLSASRELASKNRRFNMILADLGLSSPLVEMPERGFSLKNTGPLDMRMDKRQKLTAYELVNHTSEAELIQIFRRYGEEPKARQIAKNIIAERPIRSTDQLAAIAAKAWPGKSRIHPATRVFQALRIAVNDELTQLESSLLIWLELLETHGRLAVISFHSLEDRLVKRFLADHSSAKYGGDLQILTKKPIVAKNNEVVFNPRARSAKLRAAAKIKI